MKKVLIALAVLGLLALLGVGGAWFWMEQKVTAFETTAFGDDTPRIADLPKGSDAQAVGRILAREKVIASADDWQWLLRWRRLDPKLKAGEFEFSGALTPKQVIEKIVKGEVKLHRFTVAEGLRCDELMEDVAKSDLHLDRTTLVAACTDPVLAKKLKTANGRLEGWLFPDTYSFPKGVSEQQVIEAMVKASRDAYAKANAGRDPKVKLSEHEVMTLASIVEKETGQAAERPRIACLFHNRLRRGTKLQTDPTVLYGMYVVTGTFNKELAFHGFVKARETENAYNTYLIPGLPAGPISSPGAAAIAAVLHPASCDDIYFCAKGDGSGTHTFCPDLACHERAVAQYRDARAGK